MSMRHDFNDGKYTVINENGKLTALRHGEPWMRDLVGDNLVYWMLVEVDTLKEQRDELLKALQGLQANPNDPRAHRIALDAIAKVKGAPA